MKTELDEQLCREFPNVYRQRRGDMRETCMCWGFECSDGWFGLLYRLSAKLEKLILELPEDQRQHACATQVKEKFGTLSFYFGAATEEMYDAISEAESESARTCEICGDPGRTRSTGWILTLCDKHYLENVAHKLAMICISDCKIVDAMNYKDEPVKRIEFEDKTKLIEAIAGKLADKFEFKKRKRRFFDRRIFRIPKHYFEMVTSIRYRLKYLTQGKIKFFFKLYRQDLTEPFARPAKKFYRKLRRRWIDWRAGS